MDKKRQLVFISHANPEDNEFTLWIASRLTDLGYLVWSDVTKLYGAEKFWRDIEDAIRNHAAKVIIVLSRISQVKDGVLNEIHTALAVEKKNCFDRFVVPIRIDSLPSTDITSVLIQKGYIDFFQSWANGLNKLLELLEKDNVPRNYSIRSNNLSQWIDQLLSGPEKVVYEPHSVVTNWFEFKSLPVNLNFFRVPISADKLREYFESFSYPVSPYRDMIATFATMEDVASFLPQWHVATRAYSISLKSILDNECHKFHQLDRADAFRMLSNLFRTAWDITMKSKNLKPYIMANGRNAWYLSKGYNSDEWTRFQDINGVARRRRLVGRSGVRKVHWHFAMEASPSIGNTPHLVLKSHVVFTEDGLQPLSSARRMHVLRRGFCRNWWNARWRDLMIAYTSEVSLATEHTKILLSVGSNQQICVSSRPMTIESPVSVKGIVEDITERDETDEELDQLADRTDSGEEDLLDNLALVDQRDGSMEVEE